MHSTATSLDRPVPGPCGAPCGDDQFAGTISTLLASRICHDLVNPLGAVGNGIELLTLGAKPPGPELAVILESLAAAHARLGFFRIAYGAPTGGALPPRQLVELLAAVTRGSRLTAAWEVAGDVARPAAKLAFLLFHCAEAALPLGGHIAIAAEGGRWRLQAEGRRLRVEPGHWAALSDPGLAAGFGPAEVQFPLAGMELRRQGRRLEAEIGDTIRLTF